jgi:hypothetical protein
VQTDLSSDLSIASNTVIVLEPESGGGDLQEINSGGRIIQQVKTGDHSWSLTSIVDDVFPDLYKAVSLDHRNDSFQFITDGWPGDWKEVAAVFSWFKQTLCPAADILRSLDDEVQIRMRRNLAENSLFQGQSATTISSIFEVIVNSLLTVPSIRDLNEPSDVVHKKVWQLLGHFEFVSNQAESVIKAQIDRLLLEVVVNSADVARTRDALLMSVGYKARSMAGKSAI